MKCSKCGWQTRIEQEHLGVNEQNLPIIKTYAYCDRCRIRYECENINNNTERKKHSALSVWALILSLLGCTSFIGGLLALIDLFMNDKSKKHIGSWFALIFCGLFILTGGGLFGCSLILGSSDSGSVEKESSIEYYVTYEEPKGYYEEGDYFEKGNLRISINSVDLNFNDYDDEYGFYAPADGMKYVCVQFTYENIGDSDAYVSIYDYNCYADGTLMEQTYYFNNDFVNANISSGRNITFSTFYCVPVDATEIELEYNEMFSMSDEKIIIKLQ